MDLINKIPKREIIYDGKVKMTHKRNGIIRLKDKYLGSRVYAVFPLYRKDTEDGVIVALDEVLNKGVHPDNDHTSGVSFGKKYVGRKCLLVIQEA